MSWLQGLSKSPYLNRHAGENGSATLQIHPYNQPVVTTMSRFLALSILVFLACAAPLYGQHASTPTQDFVLLVYETQADLERRTSSEAAAYWEEFAAFGGELAAAGVLVGGNALEVPPVAHATGASRTAADRMSQQSDERLGGYYVVRAANIDEAFAWAEKCPATRSGRVEVRPVVPMPEPGS